MMECVTTMNENELFASKEIRSVAHFLFGQIKRMGMCKFLHHEEYGVGVMYSEGDYGYEARQYYGCTRNHRPREEGCLLYDYVGNLDHHEFKCPFAPQIIKMAEMINARIQNAQPRRPTTNE